MLPEDAFQAMKEKVQGLAAGIGTVLFFENQDVWSMLVESSPRAKPMVDPWSNVVSGMIQYAGEFIEMPFTPFVHSD